jgi:VanZ family protein
MRKNIRLIFRLHRRLVLAGCFLLWCGAFTLTHLPGPDLPEVLQHTRHEVLHFVGFWGLASSFLAVLTAYNVPRGRRLWFIFTVMLTYAAFDEMTQPLTHRHAAVEDWMVDAAGTLTATFVLEAAISLVLASHRKALDRLKLRKQSRSYILPITHTITKHAEGDA